MEESLKEEGNKQFKEKKYDEALEKYTSALSLNPNNANLYFNRALCYKSKLLWSEVALNSEQAIKVDPSYIKALGLLGQAKVELGKHEETTNMIEEGISNIQMAYQKCSGQHLRKFENDLKNITLIAKKILYYKSREIKSNKGRELYTYLSGVIKRQGDLEEEMREILEIRLKKLTLIDKKEKQTNIPDHLLCKIGFQLMQDPVITSAGYTYEREILSKYIKENGNRDPTTSETINPSKIFPNFNIKQATEEFILENPWAYNYQSEDSLDYKNIVF